LGQLALGARRAGLALALPPLALGVVVVVALLGPNRIGILAQLIDPGVLAALLGLQLALLAWRLASVGDAFRRGRGATRGKGAAVTALALALVLVPSGYAAYLTETAREASQDVFSPSGQVWAPTGRQLFEPDDDFGVAPTAGATASPEPSPTEGPSRYTVLLIGVDWGPGRTTFLTDTMIVASLDPAAGAVEMLSVPRDLVDVPLPDGRVFRGKINSLVAYAEHNLRKFPGADSGQSVLAAAIQQLLGLQIDGWAQVNLPNFVSVIDAIGGINVTVENGFCDARYREYGFNGFAIGEGRYHLDGEGALAYARIRKAAGESDFTRAARQAQVIVAARDRIVAGGFLADPGKFIRSMGKLVSTSIEPAALAELAEPAAGIARDHIFQKILTYPNIHYVAGDPRGWIVVPDLPRIERLVARVFPPVGTLPVGIDPMPEEGDGPARKKLPAVDCYVPKSTPAPTPTPSPSPTLSDEPSGPPPPSPSGSPTPSPSGSPAPSPSGSPAPTPTAAPSGPSPSAS